MGCPNHELLMIGTVIDCGKGWMTVRRNDGEEFLVECGTDHEPGQVLTFEPDRTYADAVEPGES